MPKRKKEESKRDYVKRCISVVIKEGATPKQAAGKCYGMAKKKGGK